MGKWVGGSGFDECDFGGGLIAVVHHNDNKNQTYTPVLEIAGQTISEGRPTKNYDKAGAKALQMAEEWLVKMLAEVRAAKEGK